MMTMQQRVSEPSAKVVRPQGASKGSRTSPRRAGGDRSCSALLVTLVLGFAVLASAVSVVYVKHLNRKLFVDLQRLEREHDGLEVEWAQLQLERSTWATHERIETIAQTRLKLHIPPLESIVLVTP